MITYFTHDCCAVGCARHRMNSRARCGNGGGRLGAPAWAAASSAYFGEALSIYFVMLMSRGRICSDFFPVASFFLAIRPPFNRRGDDRLGNTLPYSTARRLPTMPRANLCSFEASSCSDERVKAVNGPSAR